MEDASRGKACDEQDPKTLQATLPAALHDVLETEYNALLGDLKLPDGFDQLTQTARNAEARYRQARKKAAAAPAACHQALEEELQAERDCRAALYQTLWRDRPLNALCFSGGGIRSATFCLGVLQGLARLETLDKFDYLSTVSGGGYIASWLSCWVYREAGIHAVQKALGQPDSDFKRPNIDPEPEPLRHLRSYSNYLHPDASLLSADTWSLVATVFRNILLNWLILAPALAVLLLVPRLFLAVVRVMVFYPPDNIWLAAIAIAGILLPTWSFWFVAWNLPSLSKRNASQRDVIKHALIPLLAGSCLLTASWEAYAHQAASGARLLLYFALTGGLVHVLSWLLAGQVLFKLLGSAALTGMLGGVLSYLILVRGLNPDLPVFYAVLSVPALVGAAGLTGVVFIGLASKFTTDDDREWWSRSGAWLLMALLAWLAAMLIGVGGPSGLLNAGNGIRSAIAAAGGVTGLISILLGRSAETSSGRQQAGGQPVSTLASWALKLAVPVFTIILLSAIGLGAESIRLAVFGHEFKSGMDGVAELINAPPQEVLAIAAGLALLCFIAQLSVNVNIFSLHAMYRDRLIRAYLGASRKLTDRKPNLFTGFDPKDNLRMYELKQNRPIHILNIALNLVHGANLAWQQRKAEPFTMSPFHWGSYRLGYRRSDLISRSDRDKGLSLGTAAAISGAAASPNMGYQSSPLLTFLMTMFNARLGWWLGNPGENGAAVWYKRGPVHALVPLVSELFGFTDDQNEYVNLSDGGHFENLALYEMVLRRCRRIVVVDGGCDPDYQFEDLGNALRKIRVDLGISVAFSFPPMTTLERQQAAGKKSAHCALGRINYKDVDGDGALPGTILYIKPVLNGNETTDILHYAAKDPRFPQQPTLTDQSYDESQFESYRRLGLHSIEEISNFETNPMNSLDGLFDAARAYCGPDDSDPTRAYQACF